MNNFVVILLVLAPSLFLFGCVQQLQETISNATPTAISRLYCNVDSDCVWEACPYTACINKNFKQNLTGLKCFAMRLPEICACVDNTCMKVSE